MAFTQRMVLKSATTMSLHERFSQLRQTVPPPAPAAPTYTPPAARATTAPPSAPPRIYEDDDVEIVGGRGPNYHGIFRQRSTRSEFSSRPLSHSLAFEMAMKIKRKSIKQRLGQTRNQHGYRPWYRRNWSRGGRGGRNWNYRGRSQQNSNFNRWNQGYSNPQFRRFRGRGRGRGRGGRFMNRRNNGPKVTKDELDKEMDDYMANTKSFLDQEMDDYMAQRQKSAITVE